MLNISGIEEGYVIDHIRAGKSMDIYKYLKLDKLDCQVAIIKNATSSKMGKKDIIKVQGNMDLNLDILGFVDDQITVNIIKGGKIVAKQKPKLTSNHCKCHPVQKSPVHFFSGAGTASDFKLTDTETRTYRCIYCDEKFDSK